MSEDPVLLPQVKKMLEAAQEERGELRYEQKLALEHAQIFTRLSVTDAKKLYKELQKIDRITPELAAKLSDLCPQSEDEVRAVFAKERFNLSESDVKNILDAVAKYV